MKKPQLVLIEWIDVESDATWMDSGEMSKWSKKSPTAKEIGWIYSETDTMVVLFSQFFPDGTIGNKTKIPKSFIKNRKILEE